MKKKLGQSKGLGQVKQHNQVNFLDLNLDLEVKVYRVDQVDLLLGLDKTQISKFIQREFNKVLKVIKSDKRVHHLDLEETLIIKFQELLHKDCKAKVIKEVKCMAQTMLK